MLCCPLPEAGSERLGEQLESTTNTQNRYAGILQHLKIEFQISEQAGFQ